jgi:hypothetical protein
VHWSNIAIVNQNWGRDFVILCFASPITGDNAGSLTCVVVLGAHEDCRGSF